MKLLYIRFKFLSLKPLINTRFPLALHEYLHNLGASTI